MNPDYPRGIRNNNPGNIRLGDSAWLGLADIQSDKEFCVFSQPVYGLRAMMKLLLNYKRLYGVNTVEGIIYRWAPPEDNNPTEKYVQHVCKSLNVRRDEPLTLDEPTLVTLAEAITIKENGHPHDGLPPYWYSVQLYRDAAKMALESN